jgi:hypothetical protein
MQLIKAVKEVRQRATHQIVKRAMEIKGTNTEMETKSKGTRAQGFF